ncbi:TMV resistance protein N-like [Eucalyptus grandis]|uniref:TMV resistance protein N-like n=1 Tax=Eucalyptus grandis TaxID=71139 RepID=UPI00192EFB62|nr:TMV resistance protein N-like [Eucalyptus grandis]
MVPAMERDGGSRIEYEVFLSFRGADSRETFTDCLYEGMKGAGIRVFRDDDELQVSQRINEELPRAIESSRIYMPILSRNYASSKWCLIELTKMVTMASKSDSTKEILPIYLHVNLDDVKLKTPLYHDSFVQHERNFGADQVKVWRYGKLIKEIVQEVLIKPNAGYKNVTEHLVEDHVQIDAIMKLLDVDYSGVRFVGVHGIGGIGKLPLAIEVIGSSLSGVSTDKALWEETLKKLQKVPPKEVQETLMISYEGLEPTQRKPHDAIRVLLLRSLIKIGDDNKFSMHDQVRDLGRHIVYEENCRFPGKRSRVWNPEEALNLLRTKQASEEIEAPSLSHNGHSDGGGYTFTDEELQRLRSLRFLRGKGLNFVGNFKDHCELRWLSWHECPPNFTAMNFCLVNVVVLDLSRSKITEDWTKWSQIKHWGIVPFKDLGRIGHSRLWIASHDESSPCLKQLESKEFHELRQLPELPSSLTSLTLDVYHCQITPDLTNLVNLDHLDLSFYRDYLGGTGKWKELLSLRKNIKSIHRLPSSLSTLKLTDITPLLQFSNFRNLSKLSISSCLMMHFPVLEHLENLRELSVEKCASIVGMPNLSSLKNLETLYLSDLQELVELQGVVSVLDSIRNLKKFIVTRMGNMKIGKLPDSIKHLEMLEELHCPDCQGISSEIQRDIGELSHLRILDLGIGISKFPPTISSLLQLEELELKDCHEL